MIRRALLILAFLAAAAAGAGFIYGLWVAAGATLCAQGAASECG